MTRSMKECYSALQKVQEAKCADDQHIIQGLRGSLGFDKHYDVAKCGRVSHWVSKKVLSVKFSTMITKHFWGCLGHQM
jgi:hypothetical protein